MDDAAPPPIGRKLKRARERLRWSQAQLADSIGVTQKTVDNWEHDRSYPKSSIGALEAVLFVRLDEEESPAFEAVSDDLRAQIARILGDGTPAYRRVIGLLEKTLTWPEPNGGQAVERSAR